MVDGDVILAETSVPAGAIRPLDLFVLNVWSVVLIGSILRTME